jgi:chromosome segregation ATPase
MAEDGVTREIEEALNKIVNTTDQSGNMRKELKKTIFETVSTLRNLFVTLKVQLEEGKSEKARLESELKDTKTILDECRKTSNKAETERHPETSSDRGGNYQNQSAGRCCRRINIYQNKTTNYTLT